MMDGVGSQTHELDDVGRGTKVYVEEITEIVG